MILLESAGRPDAAADPELEGAVGLTQILAETARDLLGMRVDTAAARRIGRSLRRAERRGHAALIARLRARRRRIDERFDPPKAIAGAARYLRIARRALGRDDLAVVSYHMGIGNLQGALRAYGDDDVCYARLYFDSTPLEHAEAHRRLATLGDDSATYLWRVRAAEEIMRLYRDDPARLDRTAALQTAKNSAEEVLHPADATDRLADPGGRAARLRRRRPRRADRRRPGPPRARARPRDGRARRPPRRAARDVPRPAPAGARAARLPRREGAGAVRHRSRWS